MIKINDNSLSHSLKGVIRIYSEDVNTGEIKFLEQSENTITISGMQWIMMKMFGLYLDSQHAVPYEVLNKDTTLVVPDLNDSSMYSIGIDPNNYTTMNENISSDSFIQGFMVGNGGSGEDAITTKNTDYSFTKLRNPIPFQQVNGTLEPNIANMYLGKLRNPSSVVSSYYIKKFDELPHIYHTWWKDDQKWDYLDPVTQNDLGPNAANGIGKTNRIATYTQCKLTLDENDCSSYFSHDGNTQTPQINELGLVAFDTVLGHRSMVTKAYETYLTNIINIIFNNERVESDIPRCIAYANDILEAFNNIIINGMTFTHIAITNTKMNGLISTLTNLKNMETITTEEFEELQTQLSNTDNNIGVVALYNQNGVLISTSDNFLSILTEDAFSDMSTDEAQRIKLITYYTFNSIPLQTNLKIHIYYRIYAN